MKRCPECDFIYEDDQRLCDMDGTALVHDSHVLPEDSTVLRLPPAKPVWQQVALAIPLIVLTGLGFCVFTYQTASQNSPSASSIEASASESAPRSTSLADPPFLSPTIEDAAGYSNPHQSLSENIRSDSSGAVRALPWRSVSPASTGSAKGPRPPIATGRRVSRAYGPAGKRESRIGSFLKKTGRFLKKPFKR